MAKTSASATPQALGANPQHLPMDDLHSSSDQSLISTLSTSPYTFLQPPPSLHLAALVLAKRYLDPLASSISQVQSQRQEEARKKRKRGKDDIGSRNRILQLTQIYLDDRFSIEQVWAQAKRVLDATGDEVERGLPQIINPDEEDTVVPKVTNGQSEEKQQVNLVGFDDDGFEVGGSDEDSLGEEGIDWEVEDVKDEGDQEMGDADGITNGEVFEDGEDIEMDDGYPDASSLEAEEPMDVFKEDPNGLNDGFFSIEDFNKQSEFLERQDVAGDAAASDDEEIDWDADPMTMQPTASQSRGGANNGRISEEDEDEDEEEDDRGPTFGNADLNAPESDSEDEQDQDSIDNMDGMQNTNEIHYKDFFAPPARKASEWSKATRLPHSQPPRKTSPTNNSASPEEEGEEIQRTISAVRRDLFDDDALSANSSSSVTSTNPNKNHLSTHQRRQAKLAQEIRQLEAANVSKRDWTLSGEARATDRPLNSLLSEDLQFERTGKPVPVITSQVSEDIETLIKRRILAQDFDEVTRRRPDSSLLNPNTATNNNVRRGRFELADTKPAQSLADIYEQEHLRKNDPTASASSDNIDAKTKKEHAEIEKLWSSVCAKLDALSSWHYKPKPPAPSLAVVAHVPSISIEDKRPGTAADIGGAASMLAPQEVYKPGGEGGGGGGGGAGGATSREVVLKSGIPIRLEEMSRDEKIRRRRREKERIRKGMGGAKLAREGGKSGAGAGRKVGKSGTQGMAGRKEEDKGGQKQVVTSLKKGGVRVIGRKGEIRDVEGKIIREQERRDGGMGMGMGAGGFKL